MKRKILILGVTHLDNPANGDLILIDNGDIKSDLRQSELHELLTALKRFHPTKIGLEIAQEKNEEVNTEYQNYLNGALELSSDEKHQIGFKLAKQLNLSCVHCIDWNKAQPHVPIFFQWAEESENEAWKTLHSQIMLDATELQTYIQTHSLNEILLKINDESYSKKDHQYYMNFALLGDKNQEIGAQWVVQYWYYRNMLLYKRLTELFESNEDRVLFLVGCAHVYLLKQFLTEQGGFEVVDAKQYLVLET